MLMHTNVCTVQGLNTRPHACRRLFALLRQIGPQKRTTAWLVSPNHQKFPIKSVLKEVNNVENQMEKIDS
jgi:hypothetical protein